MFWKSSKHSRWFPARMPPPAHASRCLFDWAPLRKCIHLRHCCGRPGLPTNEDWYYMSSSTTSKKSFVLVRKQRAKNLNLNAHDRRSRVREAKRLVYDIFLHRTPDLQLYSHILHARYRSAENFVLRHGHLVSAHVLKSVLLISS